MSGVDRRDVASRARAYLPGRRAAALAALVATGFAGHSAPRPPGAAAPPSVNIDSLVERFGGRRVPVRSSELRGLRLLFDSPLPARPTLAVVRSVLRSNPRLDPIEAMALADLAVAAAGAQGLPPGFFCATLLQESAFDPGARSGAGAVGIAQFTLPTAADEGVDPYDPAAAIPAAAALLSRYARGYAAAYADRYAVTLAAYNAGPGAVDAYHGVPPYAETREYVDLIYDRWSRIVRDEHPPYAPRERGLRTG